VHQVGDQTNEKKSVFKNFSVILGKCASHSIFLFLLHGTVRFPCNLTVLF